jgi:hypothetical protein
MPIVRSVFAGCEDAAMRLMLAVDARREARRAARPERSSAQVPVRISTVGDQLREVIELEIGRKLSCADCLGYLKKLNQTDQHDHDEIVQYLSAQFPWPAAWRDKNTRRREAISALIAGVVPLKQGPS